MSATQQAKRKRKQMANGFAHLPPNKRPNFRKADGSDKAIGKAKGRK